MDDTKRREPHSPAPTISGGSSMKSGESPATEPPAPRRRGQKRKSTTSLSASSSAPPKRHAREKAAAAAAAAAAGFSSFLPPTHNGPLTRARQLSDNAAAVKNESSLAAKESAAGADVREEARAVSEEYAALEAAIEAEFEAIRSREKNAHVVPVAAGWFSWTNIHQLEKQTLQSFFNGKLESRTPEIYMEIRNWIMKRFHANPSTNIELKDMSELSTGDLDARQEVMEFLDHWGLINYHPFPSNDSANNDTDPNTDGDKAKKTDSVLEKLFRFENELSSAQIVPRANTSTLAMPTGLFRESAIAEELVKQEGPAVEYHCNSCSADCSRKRYHCQKQADFDLCTDCYNNGKFGSGMCPSDFILMEPGEAGASGGKWTDQETLLLLEALELYKENWNEIAEHVATKTKAQCILHFLQMPIEDSFLDYDDTVDTSKEIAGPTSVNNDSSVAKDTSEAAGIKTDKDSEPAESGSTKQNPEPAESRSGKDDVGPPERKTDADTAQPVSSVTETLMVEAVQDGKVTQDKGDNIVLKALKDTFDAVGFPLAPDDKLSFSEVGNPVMVLAGFLARLVEPGVAAASARSSLKLMSKSSGSQLAARHCFLVEDPPDDKKDQTGSESGAAGNTDQNPPEAVHQDCEKDKENSHNKTNSTNQSEENSTPLSGVTHSKDDQSNEKKDSTSGDKPEMPSEIQDAHAEKAKKPDEEKSLIAEKSEEEKLIAEEKSELQKSPVAEKSCEEKSEAEKPGEEKSQVAERADEDKSLTPTADKVKENSVEQAGKKVLSELQSPPLQKDQSPGDPKEQDDSASKVNPPRPANESDLKSAGEAAQCTEAPKDVDMVSGFLPSDKTEQPEKVLPDQVLGVGSEMGEDKMEVDKTGDPKLKESTEGKDDPDVVKLKRATLATLSAAAVKAKLLANQEEDEIRQLAALLIEKQLRKVELKLSFFTEMDSAILRVREQLDRSRQKLFNERAQIIASRLNLSGSSFRGLPSGFPVNRMPPSLLNSMLRPPMSMAGQRPPMSRPVMTSAAHPATNVSATPEETGGGPKQPNAPEKPSSVGTN